VAFLLPPTGAAAVYKNRQKDDRAIACCCHTQSGYRRDRRKDLLLQENGYFVLRFLAADVGTHLDDVLDAIQRTLAHRRGGQL